MEIERASGVVKFWNEKGWGAISSDALPPGRDAWAHWSVVDMPGYTVLEAGQSVDFTFHRQVYESFDYVADSVLPR